MEPYYHIKHQISSGSGVGRSGDFWQMGHEAFKMEATLAFAYGGTPSNQPWVLLEPLLYRTCHKHHTITLA